METSPPGKILIIENSGTLRKALVQFLSDQYLVRECDSVSAGKEEIRKFQPDLILLEKEFIDLYGADILQQLKTESTSIMSIVLLSGTASIDEAVAAIKSGAVDLISKPVEPARLNRIVEQNLKHIRRRRTLIDFPQYPDTVKDHGAWTFSGNLESVYIADLLQFPAMSQLTGTLEVQSGLVNTSIFFLNGEIMSAGSSDPRLYLSQFLLRKGIVTENLLLELIHKQDEDRVFLGKLLIQEGIANETTVSEILIAKITETVTSLFLQKKGVYNFYQNLVPPYLFHIVNVPVLGLIMEGEVKSENWQKIRKVIPNLGMIVEMVNPSEKLDTGNNGSGESLRGMLSGDYTIEDILYETHTTDWELLSTLYPLYEKGLISFRSSEIPEESHEKVAVEQSMEKVRRLLVGGEYSRALKLLYRLLKHSDCDLNLTLPLLEDAEDRYTKWFYSHVMRTQDVPLLCSETTPRTGKQAMEVFLLNRINGVRNVRALVNLSPAREVEVLSALQDLMEAGVIELQSTRSSDEIPGPQIEEPTVVQKVVEEILGEFPIGVLLLNSDGMIQSASKYFLNIAGLKIESIRGRSISMIFPDLQLREIQDSYEREFVWRGLEGTSAILRYWLYSAHSFSGGAFQSGITILIRDVTETHRRDLDDSRKDRLTSLGEFVAGMIHQLKNPVMLLETGVKLLTKDENPQPNQIREIGQRMEKNVDRIRNLIANTLNYVSMDESAFTWIDLNSLIENTLQMFREQPGCVEFQFQPLPKVPMIRGNPVQIREVVINLVSNAIQSMQGQGRLQIVTDLQEELEGGISRKYLLMVVSDTGPGMPPAVMEKAFTPFFTTKAAGRGLGLAFAKRILEEQGGFIRCWSKEGIGTHFYVYFKIGEQNAF
jgi:signal transduction histidine kinase/ActR/RegA family two-component response regulator